MDQEQMFPKISPAPSTARDVFMYLLITATLYASIIFFIMLIFAYVDYSYPDKLNFYYTGILDQIRVASSALIVVFPVFISLFAYIRREYVKIPEKKEIWVRRWLVYLTLFVAAVTIIIDLVLLIYNFYSGELTASFLLKIITVLAVAAAVFGYYLWDIRNKITSPRLTKTLALTISLVVLVAIIGGFFIVGSPATQRARRFDDQRVSDLQSIQSTIAYTYYQAKSTLPDNLGQLRDDISGFIPPVDPETQKPYEYKKLSPLQFELCADFKTESLDEQTSNPAVAPIIGREESWKHGAGKTCFTRTIDPDYYKNVVKPAPVY